MRIRTGVNSRSSCTPIFKALKLLILAGQYTLSLTFKRRMSVIRDGQPAPLPPNDSYMRRAAAVTSIGPDRFMRSNKAIATDQDPCP